MKLAQLSALVMASIISSVALAEGGGDRTFERMMATKDRAMEAFVAKEEVRGSVVSKEKKEDTTKAL